MQFKLPMQLSRMQKGLLLFAFIMTLFTSSRLVLYLTHLEIFSVLSPAMTAQAFINGLRFDASIILRIIAIPLLLMWLPLRFLDRRVWFDGFAWLLYLSGLAFLLMLIGDIIYFENVSRHVSYELLELRNDLNFVFAFALKSHLITLLLFVLFAVAMGWVWLRILQIPIKPSRYALGKYFVLVFLLFVAGRGGVSGKTIDIIDAYGEDVPAYGHLSLNGVFSTASFAMRMEDVNHHFFEYEEALRLVKNGLPIPVSDPDYPLIRNYPAKPKGHNLVFVLLESWNFDYVDSFAGKGYGVTPYFDELARDGLRFTRFYASGQRSIEGIQATLTGIPVLKGLPRLDSGIGISNVSRLGSLVKEKGYSTVFAQASSRNSFRINSVASATGFDEIYGMQDVPLLLDYPDPESAIFGWDYDTLQLLQSRLNAQTQPFLAYAFTGTTHQPYAELPQEFMRHLPHGTSTENGYLNTLFYSDWSLGQFMIKAKESDWFDNTIFIFTADHVNKFQTGKDLTQRFHIPLLIYAPKIIPADTNAVIGSQLDMLPTILDILGIDGEFTALGESLFRKKEGGEALITVGGQHLVFINSDGYLQHDLNRILSSRGIAAEDLPMLEKRLLAMDQVTYELLKTNRWAR